MGLVALDSVGVLLIFIGTAKPRLPWLYVHIGLMLAEVPLVAVGWRAGGCALPALASVARRWRSSAGAQYAGHALAECLQDPHPAMPPVSMTRGRRRRRAVLPQLGADHRRQEDPGGILHEVRRL
jgi:hypothetical protein